VFTLADYLDDLGIESAPAERGWTNAEQPHCLCGRFAKYLGSRSYYNGTWDCYSYTVECKRCGTVTIECV